MSWTNLSHPLEKVFTINFPKKFLAHCTHLFQFHLLKNKKWFITKNSAHVAPIVIASLGASSLTWALTYKEDKWLKKLRKLNSHARVFCRERAKEMKKCAFAQHMSNGKSNGVSCDIKMNDFIKINWCRLEEAIRQKLREYDEIKFALLWHRIKIQLFPFLWH